MLLPDSLVDGFDFLKVFRPFAENKVPAAMLKPAIKRPLILENAKRNEFFTGVLREEEGRPSFFYRLTILQAGSCLSNLRIKFLLEG